MEEKKNTSRYEALSSILKAMAHPTRMLIIEELSKNSRNVGELTAMVGVDTSTISKHLLVLKNAGIIDCEKERNRMNYSLKVPCVLNFISCIEGVIQKNAHDQMCIVETLSNTNKE